MSTQVDQKRAEAFAERMLEMLNQGALTTMTSVGHRTGLFDAMADLPPTTSQGIANAAGLDERYVREWLGAMVTGGIVHYNPADRTYELPSEHAAFLTRAATPDNIAAFAQYIPLLGSVEDHIVRSFREGGGVPYSAYPRFHQVMAEDSGQTVVAALIDYILPLVPGLHEALEAGSDVLDVGCGSGRALNLMAATYPNSHFTGYDLSSEAIENARDEARRQGSRNIRFEVRDVTDLGETEQYDLITAFDAIHDQAQPRRVLRGIATALRPKGVFLMQDIRASSAVDKNTDHPIGTLLYTLSCMHCMTVSLAQGGEGLGAMWGEEKARELLAEAGFTSVEVQQLPHDFQNNYFIIRKG